MLKDVLSTPSPSNRVDNVLIITTQIAKTNLSLFSKSKPNKAQNQSLSFLLHDVGFDLCIEVRSPQMFSNPIIAHQFTTK